LGATITLLIIGVAVGFLAKLGASSAEQRRRAAASANHHLGGAQAMTATAAGLGVGSKVNFRNGFVQDIDAPKIDTLIFVFEFRLGLEFSRFFSWYWSKYRPGHCI
jgi:hypothetical protein